MAEIPCVRPMFLLIIAKNVRVHIAIIWLKVWIAAEAMRTVWAKTLERRRPPRGELNSTAFLFCRHLVTLHLGERFRF